MPSDIKDLGKEEKKPIEFKSKDDAAEDKKGTGGSKDAPKKVRSQPPDGSLGKKPGMLSGLKDSKALWPLIFIITIPLNVLLMYVGYCLATVLVAFATFGIPYLLGVRKARQYLAYGTVIILVTGAAYGALWTHFMYTGTGPYDLPDLEDASPTKTMVRGTVSPYSGAANLVYRYSVTCQNINFSNAEVTLIIKAPNSHPSFEKENPDDSQSAYIRRVPMNHTGGGVFTASATLGADIYNYAFQARTYSGGKYTYYNTTWGLGPITKPYNSLMGENLLWFTLLTLLLVGLLYYVVVGMYWWTQRAKQEREKYLERIEDDMEKEGKKKGEFTCSSCGADVGADDSRCPKCGESFEGEGKGKADEGKEEDKTAEKPEEKTKEKPEETEEKGETTGGNEKM